MSKFNEKQAETVRVEMGKPDHDAVAAKVASFDWSAPRATDRWRDWFLEHCGAGKVREYRGNWQLNAMPAFKLWIDRIEHYERGGGKYPAIPGAREKFYAAAPSRAEDARESKAEPVDNPFDF